MAVTSVLTAMNTYSDVKEAGEEGGGAAKSLGYTTLVLDNIFFFFNHLTKGLAHITPKLWVLEPFRGAAYHSFDCM